MKKLTLLVVTMILATVGFANPSQSDSENISKLQQALKTTQATDTSKKEQALHFVYGGADISRRPTTVLHTTFA